MYHFYKPPHSVALTSKQIADRGLLLLQLAVQRAAVCSEQDVTSKVSALFSQFCRLSLIRRKTISEPAKVLSEKHSDTRLTFCIKPIERDSFQTIIEAVQKTLGESLPGEKRREVAANEDQFVALRRIGYRRSAKFEELRLNIFEFAFSLLKRYTEMLKPEPAVLNHCPNTILADDRIVVLTERMHDRAVLMAGVQ